MQGTLGLRLQIGADANRQRAGPWRAGSRGPDFCEISKSQLASQKSPGKCTFFTGPFHFPQRKVRQDRCHIASTRTNEETCRLFFPVNRPAIASVNAVTPPSIRRQPHTDAGTARSAALPGAPICKRIITLRLQARPVISARRFHPVSA
jgi:hypothetical protein